MRQENGYRTCITITDIIIVFIFLLTFIIPRTIPGLGMGMMNPIYKIFHYLYRIILVFVFLVFIAKFNYKKKKIYYIFILFTSLMFLNNYFFWGSRNSTYTIYLLTIPAIYYILINYQGKYKHALFLYKISFMSLVIQLLFYARSQRITFGCSDPNYSGLLSLYFLYLSYKLGKKTGIIFSIFTIFLFISRAQLLAFTIFFLVEYADRTRIFTKLLKVFRLYKIERIYILAFAIFIFLNYFMLANYVFNVDYTTGYSRLLIINDLSNYFRFEKNVEIINQITTNEIYAMYGYDKQETYLKETKYQIFPHNDILFMTVFTGFIYTFGFFIFIFKILQPFFFRNISFLVSLIIYSLILGVFKDPYHLLFVIFIVSLPKKAIN